jgi:xanthine dehydrogenase small subunit
MRPASPSRHGRHPRGARPACEDRLPGRPWSEATVEAAAQAIAEDYQPLSDSAGSAEYRLAAAANLVRGLWLEPESLFDV